MADDNAVDVPLAIKTADLPVRTASAAVMLAVAGGAWWLGGWWWTGLVGLIAVGVLAEWCGLVLKLTDRLLSRTLWIALGVGYVGFGAFVLAVIRDLPFEMGRRAVLIVVGAVVAVDIGAYAFGRVIGGPKIAPRISPSKTWAGLLGGVVGASAVIVANNAQGETINLSLIAQAIAAGALIAVVAQAGDFFESWMKRRAGVKDSGALIPGHGGLFDRVDGLLAVCFAIGAVELIGRLLA